MQPTIIYQITIQETLDAQWSEWFLPLFIRGEPDGETMLCGPIRDQAELHGLLAKIRDLNLTLVAIHRVEPGAESG